MSRELLPPRYIGDGVYIHDQETRIAIAVDNHSNIVVYMEASEINQLIDYAREANIIKTK
jgi:hypothetical protein